MASIAESSDRARHDAQFQEVAASISTIDIGCLQNTFVAELLAPSEPVRNVQIVDFIRDHAIALAADSKLSHAREKLATHWREHNKFKPENPSYCGHIPFRWYLSVCAKYGCGICLGSPHVSCINDVRTRLGRFLGNVCRQRE